MDSADSPLALHCLYVDRDRQLRCNDPSATAGLGDLLAAVPIGFAPAHRPLPVCSAVCHQMARWTTTITANWRIDRGVDTKEDREVATVARSGGLARGD